MNKGIFYLLPFLALTQVAISNPLPEVEITSFLKVLERIELAESPKTVVVLPKPVSGRNVTGRRVVKVVKILKPRAGRNASRLKKRRLILRK